jgi:hypothetical protein
MTLPELQSRLNRLGVKLSLRLVIDAPAGVITPEVKTALANYKPCLLALLAGAEVGIDRLKGTEAAAPAPEESRETNVADEMPALAASEAQPVFESVVLTPSVTAAATVPWPERGPRDFRLGHRWLPWHFDRGEPGP